MITAGTELRTHQMVQEAIAQGFALAVWVEFPNEPETCFFVGYELKHQEIICPEEAIVTLYAADMADYEEERRALEELEELA